MTKDTENGFTLLELIIAVVISSVVAISISLFLQKSTSSYKQTDDEQELAGRMKFILERLRKCARHSLSTLCNWQNPPASPAFEQTETLFFVTDYDQGLEREVNFVWFDRYVAGTNPNGTNQLIHCWKESSKFPTAPTNLQALAVPPDMSGVSFSLLLAHLRDPNNFNTNGQPTMRAGWESLVFAPYPTPPPTYPSGYSAASLPIYLGRWTSPPGVGANAWPTISTGITPPSGIAFNTASDMVLTAGAIPTFSFVSNSSPATRRAPLNELCVQATSPYLQPAAGTPLGSPHCQVYINMGMDQNRDGTMDTLEPSLQLLTSINLLLIPSAGTSVP